MGLDMKKEKKISKDDFKQLYHAFAAGYVFGKIGILEDRNLKEVIFDNLRDILSKENEDKDKQAMDNNQITNES